MWRLSDSFDSERVRVQMKRLERKLGDDTRNPSYIFTAHRVGDRMAEPGPR